MQLEVACTGLAVAALLIAEWRSSQLGVWFSKPLASLGFVLAAVSVGALTTAYGRLILIGLGSCAAGDVLLIPRANNRAFLLGMGSFALGHAAYSCAFYSHGAATALAAIIFGLMAFVIAFTLRWLGPHLPADMRIAVQLYMLIIATMVAFAVAISVQTHHLLIGLGAAAFAASDLSVARERFVRRSLINQLWGLPLYYAAQLLFAWSCASPIR